MFAYGNTVGLAGGLAIDLLDAALVQFAKFIEDTQTLGLAARLAGAVAVVDRPALIALLLLNDQRRDVRGARQTAADRVHRRECAPAKETKPEVMQIYGTRDTETRSVSRATRFEKSPPYTRVRLTVDF